MMKIASYEALLQPHSQESALQQRLVISSDRLFDKNDEVLIEHLGVQYRLRRTRNGKLILTK